MSTYGRNAISQKAGEYNYGDANAPTSHYNRDDEYSRRAAGLSYECQSLVGDIMSDRAQASRLYQSEVDGNGMLESDITATHMRPSELSQQNTGMGQPASMDLIDYARETQNDDFENVQDLNELEEPESSRNGSIQGSVETRSRFGNREGACVKKIIYADNGGSIVPKEINMNSECVDERFGGRRERAVSLRLKTPSLSGPNEYMRAREQARGSLVFETKTDTFGGYKGYEFENTPASLEADLSRARRVTGSSSLEDQLDNEMLNGVSDRGGVERAGVMDTINNSDKTFDMDRFDNKPSERFNASYHRDRARGGTRGVSRFNSNGEAMGSCNCENPNCPECGARDSFYSTGGTSAEYKGPARFSNAGEAFGGY
jgi:hypothetical protein